MGCRCFAIARPTVLSTHVAAAVAKMWRCITSVDASIHQASDMHQSTKHLSCINLSSICHASIYQASVMHQSIKHLSCINPSSICHASIYQASVMHQSIKHLSCINLPSICHASIYQASVLPLPEKTPCCHPACVLVVTENIAGNDTSKKSGSQPRRLLTNKWAGYILVGVRMNVNCSIVLKNMI